ncbi:MAG: UDP-N-acetylmuramoyl-L-alanyl-D-glutamate--2,6-diaminopimelate ligase, partial [Oscillospiraceae bacterium]|nr:UDP-N-acetylmuramoyl-L-alanyl-D-glutamate--2,6-diaminopimelate ligase [Oscillospiraceae bacterium]
MKLSRLAAAAGLECPREAEITGITDRAERVTPGALFAALKGARADGRDYIPLAVKNGAAAVLCREGSAPVPVLRAGEPRLALAQMAAEFYGRPGEEMTLIAVTGTKGKTTAAHMLRDILMAAGKRVGMIGTLGAYIDREAIAPAVNTTPAPVELHALLRRMADGGCSHVVMEASSQGVKLCRTAGLHFAVGVFLNLSPDHIGPGEHQDFEEYRDCKAALFAQCAMGVGNETDPAWPYMAEHLPPGAPVCTFGREEIRPGEGFWVETEGYRIPMPGRFNALNALAAIRTAQALGVGADAIGEGLSRVSVPGRCMRCPVPAPYTVLIDYAHNGAAMAALLSALREHDPGRIIAVFGAGGNRPPMRREDLGAAAQAGADFAVLTEDNPRFERTEDICAQIAAAMPKLPHVIIPDRGEAIRYALGLARPGDVVALLGKGHEEYIE